ncbi:MAG TPA: choice-of-anchor Q domain-containing protein [Anaerolineaceae bacterium]
MFALFSRRLRYITHATLGCVLVAALLCAQPSPVRAAGTVGDGTPASCTSLTLANAITAGSGEITFACGAAPFTIVITQPGGLVIPNGVNITMDGNHQIELSGGLAWRVFVVNGGGSLTLKNLSIVKGYNPSYDGGAIRNDGTLNIDGCTFTGNLTADPYSGGAIVSYGPLNISSSEFSHNQAGNGGAVYVRYAAAVTVITGTTFDYNTTTNGTNGFGGAMLLWDGAPVTLVQDIFHDNIGILGGAVFVQGSSSLTISATQFYSNLGQVTPSQGGAIFSQGKLSVTDSKFEANHADDGGAIIMASGTTNLLRSSFTRNWANYGGAYEQNGGVLLATDSWFNGNGYDLNGNPVTLIGGAIGIFNGSATLNNLTMSGNWARTGGAFYQGATSTLQNVTISGNHATYGGGIYQLNGSDMTLTNVTLYQNSATNGAGGIEWAGGTLTVRNTIVANNTTGGNCNAPFTSFAFSLSSDGSCGFGIGRDNVIIQLMGLYNTGGFAPTHLPYAGSPAVDNATLLYCPTTDERGVLRPQGAGCDVGAVERIPGELAPVAFLPLIRR